MISPGFVTSPVIYLCVSTFMPLYDSHRETLQLRRLYCQNEPGCVTEFVAHTAKPNRQIPTSMPQVGQCGALPTLTKGTGTADLV